LQVVTGQDNLDVTPWVTWFVNCVQAAADSTWQHMQVAVQKTRFWTALRERAPELSATQAKAVDKLYDAGPGGFDGGMSTAKYSHLCRVSRATAYRELNKLCEMGILSQSGVGRGTRYALRLDLTG
jgi:Fic family protein